MIMSCWYSPGEENAQNSRYVEQYFIGTTTAGIKTFKDIGRPRSKNTCPLFWYMFFFYLSSLQNVVILMINLRYFWFYEHLNNQEFEKTNLQNDTYPSILDCFCFCKVLLKRAKNLLWAEIFIFHFRSIHSTKTCKNGDFCYFLDLFLAMNIKKEKI